MCEWISSKRMNGNNVAVNLRMETMLELMCEYIFVECHMPGEGAAVA